MSTILDDPKRRTVPRWRRWRDAVHLGDLDCSAELHVPEKANPVDLAKAKSHWQANRSLPFAGDFIGVAFALGEGEVAKDAAEFVLDSQSRASNAAVNLAHLIIDEPSDGGTVLSDPQLLSEEQRRNRIRTYRRSLREFPRNPLLFMDLAREYVALGQASAAVKPVQIALALAPNSRFVLRSASRFFLHSNQPERAHDILRKVERVKSDPWLLAAEIAVANATNRTSSLVKLGRQIVGSDNFAPSHISELASALGTLEWESGNTRKAKQLFRRALQDPTENAVAQAGWISRQIGDLQLDPHIFQTPRSYEAQSWANILDGNWTDSLHAARLWLSDEPFAKRPAVFGSWAASITLGDFEESERFARHGLVLNPNEFLLSNNLAVSLAYMGRTSESVKVFDMIDPADIEDLYKPTYLATKGLIQFRLGLVEEGRRLYRMAVLEAKQRRNIHAVVWALLHFAREEFRFDPVTAERLVKEAVSDFKKLPKAHQAITARLLELVLDRKQ